MESATIISPAPMNLEVAKRLIGVQNPQDITTLSKEYACKLWATIENKEMTPDLQKEMATAYRRIAESVCEHQIATIGRFEPIVDFSVLDDVNVFPNLPGVTPCRACSGLGERIKFNKKPEEVQCLKCKTVSYILDGESINIDGDTILVNGQDKSQDSKYKWLLGRVIEDCLSCGATGRYIDEKTPGLRLNLQCKTCKGRKYTPDSEKTQVLTKCKTCKGKRKLKIPKLTASVKSTTICKVCSGLGYTKPAPELDNPVLTKVLAAEIKKL